jgi:hypothetical protein
MSDEAPKNQRKRSPYTENTGILVEFTDHGAPLDESRERKGRPERSPSLPPQEEPKPAGDQRSEE